jgi:hypothetical protein
MNRREVTGVPGSENAWEREFAHSRGVWMRKRVPSSAVNQCMTMQGG